MLLNTVSDAPLTAFQKEDLGTVYRSGMRALTLLNGLIDIARINQHEKEANPKETDIEQLIAQGLAQWKKFNPGAEVQLDYQILTSVKMIHTDEQIARQIISSFIAYVSLYCESKAAVTIIAADEPDWFLFTFTSAGRESTPAIRTGPGNVRICKSYADRITKWTDSTGGRNRRWGRRSVCSPKEVNQPIRFFMQNTDSGKHPKAALALIFVIMLMDVIASPCSYLLPLISFKNYSSQAVMVTMLTVLVCRWAIHRRSPDWETWRPLWPPSGVAGQPVRSGISAT